MGKKTAFTLEKGLLISGVKFLADTNRRENRLEQETDKKLPKMGIKAPACFEAVGRLLGQVEIMSGCAYGCPGSTIEAHTLEYFCARTSSFGRAALRLARMGFYDEAMSLVRSLGEIANLLGLFFWERSSFEEWKKSDRKYRSSHFRPVDIRERLTKIPVELPMGAERYRILCELSTHPVPEMTPQQFNPNERSLSGGFFMQEAGLLLVMNEMAVLLAWIGLFACTLLRIPKSAQEQIIADAEKALDEAGAVMLTNFRDGLKALKAKAP